MISVHFNALMYKMRIKVIITTNASVIGLGTAGTISEKVIFIILITAFA